MRFESGRNRCGADERPRLHHDLGVGIKEFDVGVRSEARVAEWNVSSDALVGGADTRSAKTVASQPWIGYPTDASTAEKKTLADRFPGHEAPPVARRAIIGTVKSYAQVDR